MLKKLSLRVLHYFTHPSTRELLLYLYYRIQGKRIIRIDASSMCQLRCPQCATGKRRTKDLAISWGTLSVENFLNLVNSNPSIGHIELSNWGEIFLNKNLKEIITIAHEKGIALSAGNGVNLNFLPEGMAEHLVKKNFRHMTVSIDGATNETYSIYRKGGDFHKVIQNIRAINVYKKKYCSEFPRLTWQFIVFPHNIHEIAAARMIAYDLNMEFFAKEEGRARYFSSQNQNSSEKRPFFMMPYCNQLWISPQVNWNGELLGCCSNKIRSFGNVFRDGLDQCMKNSEFLKMKDTVLGRRPLEEDVPCYRCCLYPHARPKESRIPFEQWRVNGDAYPEKIRAV